jgi:hypothetical protein
MQCKDVHDINSYHYYYYFDETCNLHKGIIVFYISFSTLSFELKNVVASELHNLCATCNLTWVKCHKEFY